MYIYIYIYIYTWELSRWAMGSARGASHVARKGSEPRTAQPRLAHLMNVLWMPSESRDNELEK